MPLKRIINWVGSLTTPRQHWCSLSISLELEATRAQEKMLWKSLECITTVCAHTKNHMTFETKKQRAQVVLTAFTTLSTWLAALAALSTLNSSEIGQSKMHRIFKKKKVTSRFCTGHEVLGRPFARAKVPTHPGMRRKPNSPRSTLVHQ